MGARIAVVVSRVDPVGVNLAGVLEKEYGESLVKRLVFVDKDTPFLDDLGEVAPGFDGYVVVSRHESRSGTPTLSVHHTGNPGGEALGGRPRELEWAWPSLAAWLLRRYRREAERLGLTSKYQVTLEATHHGPTRVPKPIVFIEIGSSESEWSDEKALAALAAVIAEVLQGGFEPECSVVAAGFGDTHYPRIHTRLLLEEGYCYAHIISKHAIRVVDENVVEQAMLKSIERVERVVLLKIPGDKRRLVEAVASRLGVEVERR